MTTIINHEEAVPAFPVKKEIPACGDALTQSLECNWYALSVRSRHEFIAREELLRKGIETFLPTVIKQRQWRDRKKNVEFPLFPGYLFVHLAASAQEFVRTLKVRGSVMLLSYEPGRPTPVPLEEIGALKKVLASGDYFDVYPHFHAGVRVIITKGPLQGAEGILSKRENQHWFWVNVELLGRSVGLRINAADVELR